MRFGDGEFKTGADAALGLFWAYDPFWRQAYGAVFSDPGLRLVPEEKEGRGQPTWLATKEKKPLSLAPGETRELVRICFRRQIPSKLGPWQASCARNHWLMSRSRCAIPPVLSMGPRSPFTSGSEMTGMASRRRRSAAGATARWRL